MQLLWHSKTITPSILIVRLTCNPFLIEMKIKRYKFYDRWSVQYFLMEPKELVFLLWSGTQTHICFIGQKRKEKKTTLVCFFRTMEMRRSNLDLHLKSRRKTTTTRLRAEQLLNKKYKKKKILVDWYSPD